MSNAMRFGKRSLAAVAAGALGLGMISFVAAPAAQATVSSVTLVTPGVAIVQPPAVGVGSPAVDALVPFGVVLRDANGRVTNLSTGESLTATVFTQNGVVGTNTTSFSLSDDSATGASQRGFQNVPLKRFDAAPATTGQYFGFLNPKNASNIAVWNQPGVAGAADDTGVRAGDYNVRIFYTNTNTGASITRDFPVQVLLPTARPTATMTWVSAGGVNVVNTVAAVEDDSALPTYVSLTNSSGYPIVGGAALLSGSTSPATVAAGSSTNNATSATGFTGNTNVAGTLVSTLPPGVYSLSPAGGSTSSWRPASSGSWTATYNVSQSTTLPVVFGELSSGSDTTATATLTTTPNNLPVTSPVTPEVPAGTTTLTYRITVDDTMAGTLAWRASASASGGQITPSAGIAAVSNNQATIQFTLNAAAAAVGSVITLTAGSNSSNATIAQGYVAPYTVTQAAAEVFVDVPANQIAKIGDPVTISGTVTNQFGTGMPGSWVISAVKNGTTTVLGTAVSAADGSFSITIPAAASPTAAGNVQYNFTASNGTDADTQSTIVNYNATGDVTTLTVSSNPVAVGGLIPAVTVPGTGTVSLTTPTTALTSQASPATTAPSPIGNTMQITPVTVPAATITIEAPEGVYLSRVLTGPVLWNAGEQKLTVSSNTPVSVWSTKTGLQTLTVTAGAKSVSVPMFAYTDPAYARNIAVTPAESTIAPNTFVTLTAKVTDVFGNAIRGVTSANVAVAQAGGGGISPTTITATNAAGETSLAYTAPTAAGTAQVTFIGSGQQFATTIAGAPAAISTAVAKITVAGTATKAILIVGERTTVSGKSGILVEGSVTGIENGKTVTPFIRFPGQTTFTEGTARPVIQGGEFTWQRKTGKRVTVFVSHDGINSNRVTIQAS